MKALISWLVFVILVCGVITTLVFSFKGSRESSKSKMYDELSDLSSRYNKKWDEMCNKCDNEQHRTEVKSELDRCRIEEMNEIRRKYSE